MKYSAELVIPQSGTESNALDFTQLRWARSVTLYAPASLAGVTTVEVAPVKNPAAADWVTLQSGGTDVALTAGKATVLEELGALGLRLSTTIAPGAGGETYRVVINEEAYGG